MTTVIQGRTVSGTPQEIAELLELIETNAKPPATDTAKTVLGQILINNQPKEPDETPPDQI